MPESDCEPVNVSLGYSRWKQLPSLATQVEALSPPLVTDPFPQTYWGLNLGAEALPATALRVQAMQSCNVHISMRLPSK